MFSPTGIILPAGNLPVRGALNNLQTTSTEAMRTITKQEDRLTYFQAIQRWGAENCAGLEASQPQAQGATG